MSKKNEELFGAYVSEAELQRPVQSESVVEESAPRNIQESSIEKVKEERTSTDGKYIDNLGYLKIDVKTLPTQGLFYPADAEVLIRAARGEEIKHWATMNDRDLEQLEQVNEILNYVVERCVVLKSNSTPGYTWKDLKDSDRIYLLLAVHEFTFIDGENELRIPISEGKELPVIKEMIDFITFPEELMQHYSPDERCFVFNLSTGRTIRMHIPSLGTGIWLKNYLDGKRVSREQFDTDFYQFAPMLIGDYRRLSQRAYEAMVEDSRGWTVKEWSLIAYVRDIISEATNPAYKYKNDNGEEVKIPLTFRGGIKALFNIQNPLSILR